MELAIRPGRGQRMLSPDLVVRVVHYLDVSVLLALLVLATSLFLASLVCCLGWACRRGAVAPAPRQAEQAAAGDSPPRVVQGFAVPLQRRKGLQPEEPGLWRRSARPGGH